MSHALTRLGGLLLFMSASGAMTGLYLWHVVTYEQRKARKNLIKRLIKTGAIQ